MHSTVINYFNSRFGLLSAWLLTLPTSTILVLIHAFGFCFWWAAGSYLGVDVFASRSFFGDDGWCEPQSQGWGVHCWGDYYYPIQLLGRDNPFDNSIPNPYPAASLILFQVFYTLGELMGGGTAGLILYLICMSIAIGGAVWAGTKGQDFNNRLVLTSCLTWLAPPVLIAMDRGNSAGFLIAGLVWFFTAYNSNKKLQQLFAVLLLSVIKPHFAIIAIIYAIRGKPLATLQILAATSLVHIVSFAILRPKDFPMNLLQWIQGIGEYQDYSSVSLPWPPNLSFAQSIYALVFGFRTFGFPISEATLRAVEGFQGAVGPMVLIVVILGLYLAKTLMSANQSVAILLAAITFGSATTFAYYAIIVVPILLDLAARKKPMVNKEKKAEKETRIQDRIDLYLWASSILSLVQLPILGFQVGDKILTSYSLIGAVWLSCFFCVFLAVTKHALGRHGRPIPVR
jgi:hypothetical protein